MRRFVAKFLGSLGCLAICLLTIGAARAEWIDPPDRPWKLETKLTLPDSSFTLKSGDASVRYSILPSLIPSVSFGWKYLKVGISKKFSFSKEASELTLLRLGLSRKYYVADFSLQKTKNLRTTANGGTLSRPDLGYTVAGVNLYGGMSFTGDVPYSMQAHFGSVEVPAGLEFDFIGTASLNWNSLGADSPVIPADQAASFGEAAELKGFKALTLSASGGLGLTVPLGEKWMMSSLAFVGYSLLAGSNVYATDNHYTADVGYQYGLRANLLYRRENHTWNLAGVLDRRTQTITRVGFQQDYLSVALGYSFRF